MGCYEGLLIPFIKNINQLFQKFRWEALSPIRISMPRLQMDQLGKSTVGETSVFKPVFTNLSSGSQVAAKIENR